MEHFLVSLDDESIKIWNKIPKGERSKFVREQLKGRKEENSDPKGLTDLIFSNKSKNTEDKPKDYSSHENKSYETAATTHANKKKNFYSSRKGSTTQLLSKL